MLADRLSEQIRRCPNFSHSALFVKQSENLKKAVDIHRNMSILAIEPILSTRSRVEMVRHELLVTRVLGEVLCTTRSRAFSWIHRIQSPPWPLPLPERIWIFAAAPLRRIRLIVLMG